MARAAREAAHTLLKAAGVRVPSAGRGPGRGRAPRSRA
jgi:hypothetical protein